jgi:hypothetical protein
LSPAVMKGLPAITLALLSTYSIILYQEGLKKRYLILSACFMALAIEMKIYTIIFLPGLLGQIMMIQRNKAKDGIAERAVLSAELTWSIIFVLLLLYISFIATSTDFSQIYRPYIIMKRIIPPRKYLGYIVLPKWLSTEYDIVLLALGVLIFTKKRMKDFLFMPIMSFILSILLVVTHYPVWYHYKPLVMVPLCWLASFAFYRTFNKENWSELQSKNRITKIKSVMISTLLLCALTLSVARLPFKYKLLQNSIDDKPLISRYRVVIGLMKVYGKYVDKNSPFVVTDQPIFPFYAQLLTHPRLADFCRRIFDSGQVRIDDFIYIIRKEKPPMVIFEDLKLVRARVVPYLKKDYVLKHAHPYLYVLKSIVIEAEKIIKDAK